MITDAVYLAIAGIGFCHAASRSMVDMGLRAGMNTLMPRNWIKRREQGRGQITSVLTKDS
jgi:hypothetical protein